MIPLAVSTEEGFLWRETAQIRMTPGTLPADLAARHDHYLHGLPKA